MAEEVWGLVGGHDLTMAARLEEVYVTVGRTGVVAREEKVVLPLVLLGGR